MMKKKEYRDKLMLKALAILLGKSELNDSQRLVQNEILSEIYSIDLVEKATDGKELKQKIKESTVKKGQNIDRPGSFTSG